MKDITTEKYDIVARRRAKLKDGEIGWTGVRQMAYASDCTVIGFGDDWFSIPDVLAWISCACAECQAECQCICSAHSPLVTRNQSNISARASRARLVHALIATTERKYAQYVTSDDIRRMSARIEAIRNHNCTESGCGQESV